MCVLRADDAEESLNEHDDGSIKENFREQDIYLPIANVARIMKNAVPQTGKVRGGVGLINTSLVTLLHLHLVLQEESLCHLKLTQVIFLK